MKSMDCVTHVETKWKAHFIIQYKCIGLNLMCAQHHSKCIDLFDGHRWCLSYVLSGLSLSCACSSVVIPLRVCCFLGADCSSYRRVSLLQAACAANHLRQPNDHLASLTTILDSYYSIYRPATLIICNIVVQMCQTDITNRSDPLRIIDRFGHRMSTDDFSTLITFITHVPFTADTTSFQLIIMAPFIHDAPML